MRRSCATIFIMHLAVGELLTTLPKMPASTFCALSGLAEFSPANVDDAEVLVALAARVQPALPNRDGKGSIADLTAVKTSLVSASVRSSPCFMRGSVSRKPQWRDCARQPRLEFPALGGQFGQLPTAAWINPPEDCIVGENSNLTLEERSIVVAQ
jgi:hypothetical protein